MLIFCVIAGAHFGGNGACVRGVEIGLGGVFGVLLKDIHAVMLGNNAGV